MTDTRTRYHRVIREHLGVDQDAITPDAEFHADLGCDSLDMVELVVALEDEFHVTIGDDEAAAVERVADGLALVEAKLAAKEVA